jgi:hypothetical protein
VCEGQLGCVPSRCSFHANSEWESTDGIGALPLLFFGTRPAWWIAPQVAYRSPTCGSPGEILGAPSGALFRGAGCDAAHRFQTEPQARRHTRLGPETAAGSGDYVAASTQSEACAGQRHHCDRGLTLQAMRDHRSVVSVCIGGRRRILDPTTPSALAHGPRRTRTPSGLLSLKARNELRDN